MREFQICAIQESNPTTPVFHQSTTLQAPATIVTVVPPAAEHLREEVLGGRKEIRLAA
jgi:hypothetical protein